MPAGKAGMMQTFVHCVWYDAQVLYAQYRRLLGRLLRVDLIQLVSNVRLSVRPSTKSFFDFNDMWYVGRGRRLMHDWMQYVWPDPKSKSKVKDMSPWKSEIRPFSKAISSPIYNEGWQVTMDSKIRAQYLKLIRDGFLIFAIVFVSRDFQVGSK